MAASFRFLKGALAILVIVLGACSSDRSQRIALDSIGSFHSELGLEPETSAISEFAKSTAVLSAQIATVRNTLGRVRDFWPSRATVHLGVFSDRVNVEGDTRFTGGWAHEAFQWRVQGKQAALEHYDIKMTPGTPANLPGSR